jgi:hypothetical protein
MATDVNISNAAAGGYTLISGGKLTTDILEVNTANIVNAAIKTAHIDTAQVTTAKIANLAVDSAQIANLAVDTLQIAGTAVETAKIKDNAVSEPISAYTIGSVLTALNTILQTASITPVFSDTTISVFCSCSFLANSGSEIGITIYRKSVDGGLTTIGSETRIELDAKGMAFSLNVIDNPIADKVATFTMKVTYQGGVTYAYNRSIILLGLKK